jgi:hypothetical protein
MDLELESEASPGLTRGDLELESTTSEGQSELGQQEFEEFSFDSTMEVEEPTSHNYTSVRYNKNLFRDWLHSQKLEDMSLSAALQHAVNFGCHKYQPLSITGHKDGTTKISSEFLVNFMSKLTAQTLKPADAIEKFLTGAVILPCQQSDSTIQGLLAQQEEKHAEQVESIAVKQRDVVSGLIMELQNLRSVVKKNPVKPLDEVGPDQRKKRLDRAVAKFQEITGEDFEQVVRFHTAATKSDEEKIKKMDGAETWDFQLRSGMTERQLDGLIKTIKDKWPTLPPLLSSAKTAAKASKEESGDLVDDLMTYSRENHCLFHIENTIAWAIKLQFAELEPGEYSVLLKSVTMEEKLMAKRNQF